MVNDPRSPRERFVMAGFLPRVWAVATTYLTRKLVWLMLLMALALVLGPNLFLEGDKESLARSYPRIRFSSSAVDSLQELQRAQQLARQADVTQIDVRGIWVDMLRKAQQEAGDTSSGVNVTAVEVEATRFLDEFPNLAGLKFDNLELHRDTLEQIGRTQGLTELSLSGVRVLVDGLIHPHTGRPQRSRHLIGSDLEHLSGLTNLEVLDLSQSNLADGVHHLARLPRLHTLILTSFENLNDDVMAELRRLPHLKTLVLAAARSDAGGPHRVTLNGLSRLADVPQLDTVHLTRSGPGGVPIEEVRKRLPQIDVRRGYFSTDRTGYTFFMLQGSLVLTMLIGMQLTGQLAQLKAGTTPGFTAPHLFVAGTTVALFGVLMYIGLVIRRADPLAAAALVSFLLAFTATVFTHGFAPDRFQRSPARRMVDSALLFTLIAGAVALGRGDGTRDLGGLATNLDAVLLGDPGPGLLLVVIGLSVVVVWRLSSKLQSFGRMSAETGVSGLVLLNAYNETVNSPVWRHQHPLSRFASTKLDDAALDVDMNNPAERVRLWAAGNPRTARTVAVMLFVLLLFQWPFVSREIARAQSMEPFPATHSIFIMHSLLLPMVGIGVSISSWKARMSILVNESLRPVTRAELRRDLFMAILRQAIVFPFLAMPFIVLAFVFGSPESRTPTLMLSLGLLPIAVMVGLYGYVMWILMIRRGWVMAALGIALYAAASLLIALYISFERLFGQTMSGADLLPGMVGLLGFGLLIVASAWRRWGTVELALIAD